MSHPAASIAVADAAGAPPSDGFDAALDEALSRAREVAGCPAVVGTLLSGRPERVRHDAEPGPAALEDACGVTKLLT